MRRFMLYLLAVAALAVGCGSEESDDQPASVPEGAVALVGDRRISVEDLNHQVELKIDALEASKQKAPKPGTARYREEIVQPLVESLVFAAQLRNIAEQLDIQVTEEQIDERLQQDIQQYYGGDRARYEQDLEKFGVTEADVREQLGLTLLQQKVQEKIYAEVDVTDEDLRTFYDENKANYATQDTRKVQFLLVSGEDTAREARTKLANGEPWNAVAREHALEPGPPSTGGSLDAQKGSLEANFEKAAFSLDTDELSQPVLVSEEYAEGSLAGKCKPDCYFLIRPTGDVVAGEQQSFESVKTSIRQSLEQQRKDEHLQARVKKLLDEQKRQTVYAPQYQPPKSADVSGGGGGDTAN